MRQKKDTEKDIESELSEEVRRIMRGTALPRRPYGRGPQILPGMEDEGIGYRGGAPREEGDDLPEDDPDFFLDDVDVDEEDGLDAPEPEGPPDFQPKGPYLFISIAFGLLFLFLIAHLIYFNLRLKDDILNSPYNTRQNLQAEHVIRGKIVSSDGAVLAETLTDDEGKEYRRYPFANVFAHAVGFSTHGKSGIELAANYELLTSHVNIVDQVINEFRKKKNSGDMVVTTLDAGIQESAYSALGDYRGAVIVMEPKTGAIRAMVSKPDFDPNTIASVWDEMVSDKTSSQLVNRATQGLYPPGSVFKIVTALAYYRTHGSMEGFSYDCLGEMTVDDYTVHCYNGTAHGEEDLSSAFAHSCNTAFSRIGLDIGADTLTGTAKTLLFGERLPIDLYSSMSKWSLSKDDGDVMLVQTAFGQGKTLVTPYHMALLVSAIANDGVLMKPYLIDSVQTAAGNVISKAKTEAWRTLFTEAEAEELTRLMEKVVEEGSASDITYTGIPAAGKTGSAEYLRSDGSIGTHSWFVGFMHPEDPDLVIAVLAEDGGAGSTTAVPIAQAVIENYYYG